LNFLVIGIPVLLLIVSLSSLNWRRSLKTVLVLVVLEGALRKWVLPQASDLLYFLKDFILLGAYIRYYGFSRFERKFIKNNFLFSLIFITSGWCLFQSLNPSLGSPIAGIFGLKVYLFYIPLIWMLPNLFQSEAELYEFFRSYFLLAIPVGLIGIVQFFSPADSVINFYAPGEVKNVATFGVNTSVRITGTFSYIGSYGAYLTVCFGLLIAMLNIKQSPLWRLATILALLLVITNSLMNGSRSVVFALILFLIGYLGIKVLTQASNTLRLLKQFLLPVLIIAVAGYLWFQPAIDSFVLRTTKNSDVNGRIATTFQEPFWFIHYKELDGYGTGATHPATQSLRRTLNLPSGESVPQVYEPEPGRIMLELGPVGFFFWYLLRLSLIIYIWLVFLKLKRPWLKELALAIFLIQAIQLYNLLVFNQAFAIYYWFISGFIFLLPKIEETENWRIEVELQQHVLSSYFSDSSYR
jgi:hypothetical protein